MYFQKVLIYHIRSSSNVLCTLFIIHSCSFLCLCLFVCLFVLNQMDWSRRGSDRSRLPTGGAA